MLKKSSIAYATRRRITLILSVMALASALAFSGCASRNMQQSSQLGEEDPYSEVVLFGEVSKDYLEEFNNCYSRAKSFWGDGDSSSETECLMYMYKVLEVKGSYIRLTAKLSGEIEDKDKLLIGVSLKEAKIFIDGQPAKMEDIKPGYLLSFYGKDMAYTLEGIINSDGSVVPTREKPFEPVTFINAWTANQSDN